MRWIAILGISLVLAGSALAAGSDEEYLEIYNEILQGDSLLQSDHPEAAAKRYLQAQSDLQKLQTEHPEWNPDIVKYRVDYLAEKLQSLQKYIPAAKPATAAAPAPTNAAPAQPGAPPAAVPVGPATVALEQENAGLKDQVRSLSSANADLQGKLKEALSVQPAAISPEQLAKAEARILALQKEKDLLSVALEQEKSSGAAAQKAANTAAIDQAIAQVKAHAAAEMQKAQEEIARYQEAAAEAGKKLIAANKQIEELKKNQAAQADQIAAWKTETESNSKKAQEELERLKAAGVESEKILAAANRELELLRTGHQPEVAIAETPKQIPEERDQLKQTLAQIATDEAEIAGLKAAVDEANKKLAAAASELEAAKAARPPETPAPDALKTTVEERDKLKDELAARTKELSDAQARHNDEMSNMRTALRQAEQQRDELEKNLALNAASKSNPAASASAGETSAKLDELQARIAVLEAKPVPYTPEERALLKMPAPDATAPPPQAAASSAHVHSIKDLPPGAGIVWAEAMRALAAGDFNTAEEKYKDVLRQDETNVFVLAYLANAQFAAGQLGDCDRTIKRALASDPEDPGSLYLLGLLRYRQDKLDEALDALSLSAKINPTNAATQNFLGCVLADKGLRPAAETAFRKALECDPDYADAHFNLAVVYAENKPPSWELARWHYKRAQALGHPKSATLDKLLDDSGGDTKQ